MLCPFDVSVLFSGVWVKTRMHLQTDTQKSERKEDVFEHTLKRISIQAFDALLSAESERSGDSHCYPLTN